MKWKMDLEFKLFLFYFPVIFVFEINSHYLFYWYSLNQEEPMEMGCELIDLQPAVFWLEIAFISTLKIITFYLGQKIWFY